MAAKKSCNYHDVLGLLGLLGQIRILSHLYFVVMNFMFLMKSKIDLAPIFVHIYCVGLGDNLKMNFSFSNRWEEHVAVV